MTTFSVIVPLIGGFAHGAVQALGTNPTNILSYTGFEANDAYANDYYSETPKFKDDFNGVNKVDLVVSTCPCAGISSASTASSVDNPKNDWLYKSTEDVLSFVEPSLLVGENSNLLLAERFRPIRQKIEDIASNHGYSVSYLRLSTNLFGIPQDRKRSLYVIHKGESKGEINLTKTLTKTTKTLEDYLSEIPYTPTQIVGKFNEGEQIVYDYLVSNDLVATGSVTLQQHVYRHNLYEQVLPLIEETKFHQTLTRGKLKFESGSRPFDTSPVVWKEHTNAMMFRNTKGYIHNLQRWITVEDVAWMMGLSDTRMFKGITPKTHNIINQNVPVCTAKGVVEYVTQNFM